MIEPKKRSAAEQALKDAVLAMSRTSHGMLPVYMGIRQRATEDPSVTVRLNVGNGCIELEYNVDFVTKLETSMLGAVLYMQCLKIALHHCDHRRKEPLSMLKLASDIVVAEYARKVVDTSKGDNYEILNRLFPSIWEHWDVLGKHGFMPETDLVLEKLFAIFSEEQAEIENQKGKKPNSVDRDVSGEGTPGEDGDKSAGEGESQGKGEGEGSPMENDGDAGDDGVQEDGSDDSPGDGTGEEGGDTGEDPGEGEDGDDNSGEGEEAAGEGSGDFAAMEKYFDIENAATETENWGQDEAVTDRITATVMDALANGMFDRVRGKLPIALRDANRLKVDTTAMFRRFIASVMADDTTPSWSRRNRKYLKYGVIAPGYLYDETPRILMCVDVSGSMYVDNLIYECLKVMDAVFNGISVDMVYWDAVCSPVFSNPKSMKEVEVYGGGFTNPDCVLQKLGPERFKYDGLVFVTDCEFTWNAPPRARQIMILRTGERKHEFPQWCVYRDDLKNFINN